MELLPAVFAFALIGACIFMTALLVLFGFIAFDIIRDIMGW